MTARRIVRWSCAAALVILLLTAFAHAAEPLVTAEPAAPSVPGHVCISGVYPHLAAFNSVVKNDGETYGSGGECGIGAIVPWAGKLWMITYSPHCPTGSTDKLFAVDEQLNVAIRPESIGGTPAGRLIHRESEQLFIGPYAIDKTGQVRVIPYKAMPGRHTAVARHLTDPANKVYYFDMEGRIYEVDVHTLKVKLLFAKPVPGWHGKGAYTGQGRYIVANNGEDAVGGHSLKELQAGGPPQGPEDNGVLAEWDGQEWRIIERRQFTEVTGPGGIHGAPDDTAPVWAVGWDRRSVLLKLLDGGKWSTFRLPKASHTYDGVGGWYTEWPRIREIAPGRLMLDMHAMLWDFPSTFSAANSAGLRPLASHHRYLPDFCSWNGRVVLATDETTIMGNPLAGQSQSNLWFGQIEDLSTWGPRTAWGGPWVHDPVQAAEPSVPFLINGFDRRCVHLAVGRGRSSQGVTFTLELDVLGNGVWTEYRKIAVPDGGYVYHLFPPGLVANWVRVTADKNCIATAFFHYSSPGHDPQDGQPLFAAVAGVNDEQAVAGLIRPGKHNRNLQYVAQCIGKDGTVSEAYYEVDEQLAFTQPEPGRTDEVREIAKVSQDFEVDEASVIMAEKGRRYRLPKGDARYDQPFATGWPRGIRECESERYLMNIHGTFYEKPREGGMWKVKPLASHHRQVMDFCTWRGLWVISGTTRDAPSDGQYFRDPAGAGLWFGAIDDLWKFGKPVGRGGPWCNTAATPGRPSDPYLMNGYDRKRVALSHAAAADVTIAIEVNVDHTDWRLYQAVQVPAGQTVTHDFPAGFCAHWVRVTVDKPCRATATFTYE